MKFLIFISLFFGIAMFYTWGFSEVCLDEPLSLFSSSSSPTDNLITSVVPNGTDFIDKWLKDWSEADVPVRSVSYYRAPMEDNRRASSHNFLVIEIEPFQWNGKKVKFHHEIKTQMTCVEKAHVEREEGNTRGGSIEVVVISPRDLRGQKMEHEVDMQGCGKIRMSTLLDILGDDLSKNNCSKYAHDTLRKLLQQCAELPNTIRSRKEALEGFLKEMDYDLLPRDFIDNTLGKRKRLDFPTVSSNNGTYDKARGKAVSASFPALPKSLASFVDLVAYSISNGTYYIDDWLKDWSKAEVLLRSVSYYREPMADKSGVFHDLLVIEIKLLEWNGTREKFYVMIKAQKTYVEKVHIKGEEGETPGGRIEVTVINPKDLDGLKVAHEVDMQGCGRIWMAALLDILGDHPTKYNPWKNNCWKYAHDTFRKLLQYCAKLPNTTRSRKEALQGFLKELPSPALPSDLIVSTLNAFYSYNIGAYFNGDWLREAYVLLRSVSYYREFMKDNRVHDFLVIEIERIDWNGRGNSIQTIKAQMTHEKKARRKRVELMVINPVELKYGILRGRVDLNGCGKIRMSTLLDILGDHKAIYKSWKWKYAHDTFRKLLRECARLPDTIISKEAFEGFLRKYPPSPSDLSGVIDNTHWTVSRIFSLMRRLWKVPSDIAIGLYKIYDENRLGTYVQGETNAAVCRNGLPSAAVLTDSAQKLWTRGSAIVQVLANQSVTLASMLSTTLHTAKQKWYRAVTILGWIILYTLVSIVGLYEVVSFCSMIYKFFLRRRRARRPKVE